MTTKAAARAVYFGEADGIHVLYSACHVWALLAILCFAVPDGATATPPGSTLESNTVWTSALPIQLTENLSVPTNVTLTIQAGALVQLGPNVSLLAQAGGTIHVAGTTAKPVLFRSLDQTNNWGRIGVEGTNANLVMRSADLERGQAAVFGGATGVFDACYFHDYRVTGIVTLHSQPILVSDRAASLMVRACHFRNYHETLFRSGVIVIEDSLFEEVTGDAVDFDAAAPGSVIRRCTMRQGPFSNADGLDLGSESQGVLVEQCLMYGFPFDKGISIGESSINITVRGCVIYGTDIGIAVKDASVATLVNNTIVDCHYGLRLYEKFRGSGRATAWNNIIWVPTNSVTLLDGSTIEVSSSDVSGEDLYPGANNLNTDPLFRNAALRDYRLAPNSPALGSGTGGTTLGAFFPVGSFRVDTDRDGLPDTWEMTHDLDWNGLADATADSDQDGLNNLQEYLAGTDPQKPASVLKVEVRVNSDPRPELEFNAVPNKAYTIEFRDSLSTGGWQKLTEISPEPSERFLRVPVAGAGSARFFRVVVSPTSQ